MAVDIEDGFGGPMVVYRTAKRLARAGAHAIQLEDSSDMQHETDLLPRELYYAKVRAAVAALEGTDCMLIARTNADPKTQIDEGCERLAHALELGADMTTLVKLNNLEDATYVAERVPGPKMYPDVMGGNGVPEVTVEQIQPLGYRLMTMHYLLKASMDGMIEHGLRNFADQGCVYTCDKQDATGVLGVSATPLWDPQAYMRLEARFTGEEKPYTIVGKEVEPLPEGFTTGAIEDRI
jgi:2-methylisocitrate lyase-like PEP mutase family enzyme